MPFSNEEYGDIHFVDWVYNGKATAADEEYQQVCHRRWIQTHVCSLMFISTWGKKAFFFPSVNHRAVSRVERNAEEGEGVVDNAQPNLLTSTSRMSARLCARHSLQTQHCIRSISRTFSILNLRTWVVIWINSNPNMILKILFTDEAHFTHSGVNNTRNSRLLDHDNLRWIVESNYQYSFSVNVWCGVIGDQLTGPYIFPQHLTGDIYADVLQDELPAPLEMFLCTHERKMY